MLYYNGHQGQTFYNTYNEDIMHVKEIYHKLISVHCWIKCQFTLQKLYVNLLNEHAPLKTRTLSNKIPCTCILHWWKLFTRNHLENLYFKGRTSTAWEHYLKLRNKVMKMREKAIKDCFMKHCSSKATKGILAVFQAVLIKTLTKQQTFYSKKMIRLLGTQGKFVNY